MHFPLHFTSLSWTSAVCRQPMDKPRTNPALISNIFKKRVKTLVSENKHNFINAAFQSPRTSRRFSR